MSVVHIVYETGNTLNGRETKSGHDVVGLTVSFFYHLEKLFDVHGVKHSRVVGGNIFLVEKTQHLVSVKTRVSSCVQSTFRN